MLKAPRKDTRVQVHRSTFLGKLLVVSSQMLYWIASPKYTLSSQSNARQYAHDINNTNGCLNCSYSTLHTPCSKALVDNMVDSVGAPGLPVAAQLPCRTTPLVHTRQVVVCSELQALDGVVVRFPSPLGVPHKRAPVFCHTLPEPDVLLIADAGKHLSNVRQAVLGQSDAELLVGQQVLVRLVHPILHDDWHTAHRHGLTHPVAPTVTLREQCSEQQQRHTLRSATASAFQQQRTQLPSTLETIAGSR